MRVDRRNIVKSVENLKKRRLKNKNEMFKFDY
ncbi:hypothetical protein ES708_05460 [subsurface metagenome]